MSETDFIFAWLLAAKAGAGTAVAWKTSTVEAQIKEARAIYQAINKGAANEIDSRAED